MSQPTTQTVVSPSAALPVLDKLVHSIKAPYFYFLGKWRLYLNYCPECNSCAPELNQCGVCHSDTKSYFAWNKEVENKWWRRYAQKHHIAH